MKVEVDENNDSNKDNDSGGEVLGKRGVVNDFFVIIELMEEKKRRKTQLNWIKGNEILILTTLVCVYYSNNTRNSSSGTLERNDD